MSENRKHPTNFSPFSPNLNLKYVQAKARLQTDRQGERDRETDRQAGINLQDGLSCLEWRSKVLNVCRYYAGPVFSILLLFLVSQTQINYFSRKYIAILT